MKTAVIIDSTAYASQKILNHPDVYELKFITTFDDGLEVVDSSDPKELENFYTRLEESTLLPKTSQPAPGEYIKQIEEIIEKGYDQLLCIHFSAALSGAYQTAKMITATYQDEIQSAVIDSKGASLVIESLVVQALEMLEKGLALEEVKEKLVWVADNSTIYLTVSDLENLVKGGRLNAGEAKIGELLKIKPLLCIGNDGEIQLLKRIRTGKRMNRRLAQIAKEAVAEFPNGFMLGFAHAMDEAQMQATIETVTQTLPNHQYQKGRLGPVVGTHTGPYAIGMGTIPIADY